MCFVVFEQFLRSRVCPREENSRPLEYQCDKLGPPRAILCNVLSTTTLSPVGDHIPRLSSSQKIFIQIIAPHPVLQHP